MNDLKLEAVLDDDKNTSGAKISGVAYSGGVVSQCWDDRPIVVDLSGMEFAPQIPLMNSHCNAVNAKLGEVDCVVVDNQLLIDGKITSSSDDAKMIIADGKKSAWQLSIGADVVESEDVKMNENVEINGRTFTGPLIRVTKSKLREVSVVAIGADAETSLKIAAKFELKGKKSMPSENEKVIAAKPAVEVVAEDHSAEIQAAATEIADKTIKAERKRISDIQSVCNGEFAEIEKEAISAGWDINLTREKVLDALRSQKPATSVNIVVASNDRNAKTLEAAFALRSGVSEDACVKAYGEQTVEAAMPDRDISIKEMMIECARIEGKTVGRSFDNETIKAAFSTVTLPGILSNVANKKLQESFAAYPVIATKLCSVGDLNDFKEAERLRLTDVGDLQPVAADGEIQDGGLAEEKATNQLETYGKKFCLTRKMIINDDLGAFLKVPTGMGNRAARLIDQLFFTRLLSNPTQGDNVALFHNTHKNLLTGADSALSKASLEKAIQKFLDQVDADGQPINIEPRFLLVPTGLKFTANELVHGAELIMAGGNDNVVRPMWNALANENLIPVASPYLANTAYTGASSKAWYLFGDPAQVDTFEIGFLKGKRTPTVERGETDYNTLGQWFRVYFDLGVREQGFRGMVKSKGEN